MPSVMRKSSPQKQVSGAESTLAIFASELGWMAAVFTGERLVRLSFGNRTREKAEKAYADLASKSSVSLSPNLERAVQRLQAFAAGESDDLLDIDVDYGVVTPFQRRVLEGCRAIPPGETLSYGELAHIAGAPGAARAVGNVMRTNKIPLVIPCHRVVGSGGALGGYSAPEGLKMKQRLLDREGAQLAK